MTKKNKLYTTGSVLICILVNQLAFSQVVTPQTGAKETSATAIRWYTMEQAGQAYKQQAKPLFIDLYTDWCGWCKKMDVSTFQDPGIANYLNANFYPVKFNAESKDTIEVFGQKFWNSQDSHLAQLIKTSDSSIKVLKDSLTWIETKKKTKFAGRIPVLNQKIDELNQQISQLQRQSGRTSHDLSRTLMNNQMSYPTFVFLFDSLRQNMPVKGYQQVNQLFSYLSFISDGVYRNTSDLTTYQTLFLQNINAVGGAKSTIKWNSANEVFSKANTSGKKVLLLITDDASYSSLTYENGTFNDEYVASYVNTEYIPVKINVRQKESIKFKEVEYKNNNGFHELPYYLMQNEVKFPSLLILDQSNNIITKIPGFYPPTDMDSILAFFKEDAFKSKSYPEFKKEYDERSK